MSKMLKQSVPAQQCGRYPRSPEHLTFLSDTASCLAR